MYSSLRLRGILNQANKPKKFRFLCSIDLNLIGWRVRQATSSLAFKVCNVLYTEVTTLLFLLFMHAFMWGFDQHTNILPLVAVMPFVVTLISWWFLFLHTDARRLGQANAIVNRVIADSATSSDDGSGVTVLTTTTPDSSDSDPPMMPSLSWPLRSRELFTTPLRSLSTLLLVGSQTPSKSRVNNGRKSRGPENVRK